MTVVPLLWVEDITDSIRFYKEIGFKITETWKPQEKIQWCCIEFEKAALMLQQKFDSDSRSSSKEDSSIQLYFITNDVDVLYRELRARGLEVSTPKVEFYGMKQIFLEDPDGRTLCFESLQSD